MIRTLEQIRAMVRRRLGWSSADTFQSEDELQVMLEQSMWELNNFLVQIHQGGHRVQTLTMAMTAGTQSYSPFIQLSQTIAANNIDRILRVAFVTDGVSVPMRRLDWEAGELLETRQPWTRGADVRYRWVRAFQELQGAATLWVYPIPDAAYVVKMHYTAMPGTFSATDAINYLGHDEFLVLDTMIKCIEAEEGDASAVERKKERYMQMVTENETPVDIGQAQTIVDQREGESAFRGRWWP